MTFSRRSCGTLFLGHPPRGLFVVLGVAGLLVGGGGGGGGRVAVAQTQPASVEAAKSAEALGKLKEWLASPADSRAKLVEQPWSKTALTREDADAAERLLWTDHSARLKNDRAKEMEAKVLKAGELEMPFWYKVNGEAPEGGRSLFISMHGGGGAPKQVNDQQWENQKRLYSPAEGVYVAPRAPTNTWDLWHQSHIDGLFDRLIENLVVFENVNPDRVYLMGYSAGGDGVYQVAPRMADRFAAASMMAGHPNESQPLGLRNLPFSLHMGGLDGAYNRNKVAEQWGEQLKKLREADPQGYEHWVKIYAGKGHWMDREDAAAVPWMAKFTRNPFPNRIVWRQDDVTEARFYWLGVSDEQRKAGAEVRAHVDGRRITLDLKGVEQIKVRLHDRLLDLDQPLEIKIGEQTAFAGRVARTIASQAASLAERADPRSVWRGEVIVSAAAAK